MRFNTLRIDKKKCERLVKAIKAYRREKDDINNIYKNKPKKGWQNHGADALRYWAVSARSFNPESFKEPEKKLPSNPYDII